MSFANLTKFNYGNIFKHYKGQYYRFLYQAIHSETEEEMIVYQQLYATIKHPEGFIWTRPATMFHSNIIINNIDVKRFVLVDNYPIDIKYILDRLDNSS